MEQTVAAVSVAEVPAHSSGLRANILSPMETLAQSISTIAPTTTPTMTIPLVFVLAGNGTWLAYLFATAAILLVGSHASAASPATPPAPARSTPTPPRPPTRRSAASRPGLSCSPTSPPAPPSPEASSTTRTSSSSPLRQIRTHRSARPPLRLPPPPSSPTVTSRSRLASCFGSKPSPSPSSPSSSPFCSGATACTSTTAQIHLQGVTASGVRLGVVLALFSFVGFESATTLGAEAAKPAPHNSARRHPKPPSSPASSSSSAPTLKPSACTRHNQNLGAIAPLPSASSPRLAHVPILGPLIDIGAFVSMFACTLACITAAARVLLQDGPRRPRPRPPRPRPRQERNASPRRPRHRPPDRTACSPHASPPAESAAPTSTAGWALSPSTASSPPTDSSPSRSPSTSSASTISPAAHALSPSPQPSPCFSPSPAPSTRSRRAPTTGSPTSTSSTSSAEWLGSPSPPATSPRSSQAI